MRSSKRTKKQRSKSPSASPSSPSVSTSAKVPGKGNVGQKSASKKRGGWWTFFRSFTGFTILFLLLGLLILPIFRSFNEVKEHSIMTVAESNNWQRGAIFDRSRKELAVTIERVSVYVRSRELSSIEETAERLAETLGLNKGAVESSLKSGSLRIWIAEDISQEQEDALTAMALPGVYLQREKKRFYPQGETASHILGFAESGVGLEGVERAYDRLLAESKNGAGSHKKLPQLSSSFEMVLTLDIEIQQLLSEVLDEIRRRAAARGEEMRAAAYLMESGSGAIIAGAHSPEFDPNHFAHYGGETRSNLFFEPLFIPEKYRIFLRDSAALYKVKNPVVASGLWSAARLKNSAGRQLQFISLLGLDSLENEFPVDFYTTQEERARERRGDAAYQEESAEYSDRPRFIPYLQKTAGKKGQKSRDLPAAQMIPIVTTPVKLLTALSTILHGAPAHPPHTIGKVVDAASGRENFVAREWQGGEAEVSRKAAAGLFKSLGVRRKGKSFYLRARSSGGIVQGDWKTDREEKRGGVKVVQHDITFVDIPSGDKPLVLLLVTETGGSGPLLFAQSKRREKAAPLPIENLLDRRVRRIAILNAAKKRVEGELELFAEESKDYGNYQAKERYVVGSSWRSSTGGEKEREEKQAKMPELKGLSLRKSLRMLQGAPVELIITGTGRVIKQYPAAGVPLKSGMQCRLVLKRSAEMQYRARKR